MRYDSKIMYSLLKQLWLQSDNCTLPIKNIAFQLMEVGKSTNQTRKEVWDYLQLLIEQEYIECISKEPLLYKFTDKGKLVKTSEDINAIIHNGG